MTTLLCRIKTQPGQEEAFARMQRDMAQSTWEEKPCRTYETFRAQAENEFYVLMSFDDYPGFVAHQLTDLHLNAPWGDLIESVDMIWLDPVSGASTLAPSTPVPIETDNPERREYLKSYSYARAAWWPEHADA